jgi:hypothetical protein
LGVSARRKKFLIATPRLCAVQGIVDTLRTRSLS